jgi:hypothetical protein
LADREATQNEPKTITKAEPHFTCVAGDSKLNSKELALAKTVENKKNWCEVVGSNFQEIMVLKVVREKHNSSDAFKEFPIIHVASPSRALSLITGSDSRRATKAGREVAFCARFCHRVDNVTTDDFLLLGTTLETRLH